MLLIAFLGLGVGLISSFFGVGGGVVIVPGLSSLFTDLPHSMIIACSLFTICINGIINSFYFYRSGARPRARVILTLGAFMVLGSLIGAKLGISLDQVLLKKLFAVLLFIVFIKTLLPKNKNKTPENIEELDGKRYTLLSFFGLCGGILAGVTGVGGGIIIVPLLVSVFQVPHKMVSSYSNPVMAMATFTASLSYFLSPLPNDVSLPTPFEHFQLGHINLLLVGILVFASALSAPFGVKLTAIISPKKSKYAFATLVFFMAIKMSLF